MTTLRKYWSFSVFAGCLVFSPVSTDGEVGAKVLLQGIHGGYVPVALA